MKKNYKKLLIMITLVLGFIITMPVCFADSNANCQKEFEETGKCGSKYKYCTWNKELQKCESKIITEKDPYDATYCTDFNKIENKEVAAKKCVVGTEKYACVWNKEFEFCNSTNLVYVECGDAFDIPYPVPKLISFLVNLLKIVTPIILIVVAVITLLKSMTSSSEDQMKKAQKSLINKIAAAVMVFFIVSIVQFVITKIAEDSEKTSLASCMSCFLNNECSSTYYKSSIGGNYTCIYTDGTLVNDDGVCNEYKVKENTND